MGEGTGRKGVRRPTDNSLVSHTEYMEFLLDYLQGCPAKVPAKKEPDQDGCATCHEQLPILNKTYEMLLKSLRRVDEDGNLNSPVLREVEEFEGVLEKIVQAGPVGALNQVENVLEIERPLGIYRKFNGYFKKMEKLRDAWLEAPIKECR